MAWVFSLSAECGAEKIAAERFSQHFDGLIFTLSNSIQAQCKATLFQDLEDNWWCRVSPENVSELGVDSPDVAYTMTELGILLYQRLRSAPAFRYALVGVEVDEFRTYHELISEIPETRFPGLVLTESIEQEWGSSATFYPFRSGYLWQPYEGEIYRPLTVSPDLKAKLNELMVLA